MLPWRDFVDADFAIEDSGQHELGSIADLVTGAGSFDVGLYRRRSQPKDRRDVGVALALSGEDDAIAPARAKMRDADLPQASAVHDPPRL